jgi:hypothetical protein
VRILTGAVGCTQSAVPFHFDLGDRAGHPGSKLAKIKPLAYLIEAIHLLEEREAVRHHEQGMEQMTVVAEPVTATARRPRILALDQQVKVIGDVLDYFVACPIGIDELPVAADRQVYPRSKDAICASVRILEYVVIEFGNASSGTVSVTSENADQGIRPVLP